MKLLIYGAGVIGSYLAHVLCAAGNDVTLLARGSWRETLERDGLTVVHHLQRKTTHDRPRIIGALDSARYDLVFAVMQYQQMLAILEDLARADSPLVVLVGNNMDAGRMEAYIQAHTAVPKAVLFGFQGTGGRREAGKAICVRFGDMGMTVGGLHDKPSAAEKQTLISAFADTKYRLTWAADMDAWYKCHLAFILPIVYLSYALDCDLRQATGKQVKTGLFGRFGRVTACSTLLAIPFCRRIRWRSSTDSREDCPISCCGLWRRPPSASWQPPTTAAARSKNWRRWTWILPLCGSKKPVCPCRIGCQRR